ncbi:CocE/NonD family hydrolase [Dactylosporangium sp. NPDC051485]|uniref:CocE/NonD family hydrolase n=1 Tax=Dactylosporangium sp. NPDC051485 TaxID=3154846 RepID=UPI0034373F68
MDTQPLDVTVASGLEATMRDGTVLCADTYRPAGDGPWPVLLTRTPYGRQDAGVLSRLDPIGAAARGYLVVIQDCRGRFGSQGRWEPLVHEGPDGYDTVRWAAALPGSDGRVAMYGPSYLGYTQWAAIRMLPPDLRAAVPEFTWADPGDGLITRGGAYELGLVTHWTLTLGFDVLQRRYADRPAQLQRHLEALHTALDGLVAHTYRELPAGEAPTLRRLGLPRPTAGHWSATPARIPTLTVAGWFDAFLQGSLDNHLSARAGGAPAALIVGPWSHDNQTRRIGDTDFGPIADAAALDGDRSLPQRELDWLDRRLRPGPDPEPEAPPVLLFVMGAGEWRRFPAWPPAAVEVAWYLRTGARLSPDAPPRPDSPPDSYEHDPGDPVPTLGGALLLAPQFPAGPCDQRPVEQRDDVLVYTSEPLRAALEVVGRITVHLFAESTAPSTDWVARLCDVGADGVSRNITDGVLRTGGSGRTTEHVIDLWSTAHVFLPGHRIRVQIASSCFPRWDRNLAAAEGGEAPTALPRARQTVYHDAARPSRIILPALHERPAPSCRLSGATKPNPVTPSPESSAPDGDRRSPASHRGSCSPSTGRPPSTGTASPPRQPMR